jgi:predicted nucleic acid-binding protein
MDKVFLDTDVILDFLLDREPFAHEAARILSLCDKKKISACSTALVFANAYYVLRKISSHKRVTEKLLLLSQWIEIIPSSKPAVVAALQSDFGDFEDALQHFSTVESSAKIIITRNIRDYKKSALSVVTPAMFLSSL